MRVHAEEGIAAAAAEVHQIEQLRAFKRRQSAETSLPAAKRREHPSQSLPPSASATQPPQAVGASAPMPVQDITSIRVGTLCSASVGVLTGLHFAGGRLAGDDERGRAWQTWSNATPEAFGNLCDEMIKLHMSGMKIWKKLLRYNNARRGIAEPQEPKEAGDGEGHQDAH